MLSEFPLYFDYKHVGGRPIFLDVYLPDNNDLLAVKRPTIIYFHGGSLTVGNRQSWFPTWLHGKRYHSIVVVTTAYNPYIKSAFRTEGSS